MKLFSNFTVSESKLSSVKSIFLIKGLEKGFGTTLGNSLRRVLLSNVPGASVFAVKINGVNHEYQAIPSIKEDALHVILNIRNLAININEEIVQNASASDLKLESMQTIKLNFSGKGIITADKLVLPTGYSVANPELYIASGLNDNSKLSLEIYACTGRGFVSFEQNRELVGRTPGIIPTNSNFSPVLHVGFEIEEKRNTKQTVNEDLHITISTNGTCTPSHALAMACHILSSHFNQITENVEKQFVSSKVIADVVVAASSFASQAATINSTPIDNLKVSTRIYNALKRSGITTIMQLCNYTYQQIKDLEGIGATAVRDIENCLKEYNLEFKKS